MSKKRKPTGKRYDIDSFEILCNVINEENFEALTTDLIIWLSYHVQYMNKIREAQPEFSKGKLNSELGKSTFIWLDDGDNKMKEVVIKNTDTGEIRTVRFTEKPKQ